MESQLTKTESSDDKSQSESTRDDASTSQSESDLRPLTNEEMMELENMKV